MATNPSQRQLIGGIEKGPVTVVDYDADWPRKFESHVNIISSAIGNRALRIEHIGSTSVPGLAAKPIVDILVVVANSADESSYLPPLEAEGYQLRVREPDWNEHRMLRTSEKDVHVHVYSAGCKETSLGFYPSLADSWRALFGPGECFKKKRDGTPHPLGMR
jgi:GrpB-like predicted nucleotidyltransferase (UPF0157 family)